jgi:hypothetical protein
MDKRKIKVSIMEEENKNLFLTRINDLKTTYKSIETYVK